VWLKSGDGRAPLIVIAGAGGDVNELSPFASHLTDARAVVCLDLAALGRWSSVDEIVDRALALIVEAQPRGPYHLLGYSFGGMIALELARRLRGSGSEVALLMLVEAVYDRSFWPLGVWAISQARRAIDHLSNLRGAPLGTAVADVSRRANRFVRRAAARLAGITLVGAKIEAAPGVVVDACLAAMARFRPRPYPGPAIFFKAERGDYFRCDLPVLWRHLVDYLEVEQIPGDHLGIVQTPAALERLAERVDSRLGGERVGAPLQANASERRPGRHLSSSPRTSA
jgi:thioesterase domain-containing protein